MSKEQIVIKKYANRRLYNTHESSYVTLEDLANMVKQGDDFVVKDAKSGEDITRSVLTQIIFEQEGKGQNLLPVNFLRQLIQYYDNSMQMLVPGYLEMSMNSFARDHDKWREVLASTMGTHGSGLLEDQIRTNTQMFEQAVRMFAPALPGLEAMTKMPGTLPDMSTWIKSMQAVMTPGADDGDNTNTENEGRKNERKSKSRARAASDDDRITVLQEQLSQMQAQLNALNKK